METTLAVHTMETLPHVTWVGVLIKAVIILAVISAIAGFGTFIERKVLAFMQRRLGPMHVGPYGLLQLAADGIKLFTKEDIVPQNANKLIFMIAPIITAATAFIALSAILIGFFQVKKLYLYSRGFLISVLYELYCCLYYSVLLFVM